MEAVCYYVLVILSPWCIKIYVKKNLRCSRSTRIGFHNLFHSAFTTTQGKGHLVLQGNSAS